MEVDVTQCHAIIAILSDMLSDQEDLKLAAKPKFDSLWRTEEFAIHLATIAFNSRMVIRTRMVASFILMNYVTDCWSSDCERFNPPEITTRAKVVLKRLLPELLGVPRNEIRCYAASAIVQIVRWEWPEKWPWFIPMVRIKLNGDNRDGVMGSLEVCSQLCDIVSDAHIYLVALPIFSETYRIFRNEQRYSLRIRSKAVEVFSTWCTRVVSSIDPETLASLNPMIPEIMECFIHMLKTEIGPFSDFGLQMVVIKAQTLLIKQSPKQMAPWLDQIMPPVWDIFFKVSTDYHWSNVMEFEIPIVVMNTDGHDTGVEEMILAMFELVETLLKYRASSKLVKKTLNSLFSHLIVLMCATEAQVRAWNSDPKLYIAIEEEIEDQQISSIRSLAQELFNTLCLEFKDISCIALSKAANEHMDINVHYRALNSNQWWKFHESCTLAVGNAMEVVVSEMTAEEDQFNFVNFLEAVVLDGLTLSEFPFVVGRSLWFTGLYARYLPTEAFSRSLEAITTIVQSDQSLKRINAVRTLQIFSKLSRYSRRSDLLRVFPCIVQGLVTMGTTATVEFLCLILESLMHILVVDADFTATVKCTVTPFLVAMFLKHRTDAFTLYLMVKLFRRLSENPQCVRHLHAEIVPPLVDSLNSPTDEHHVTLKMLGNLVRHSDLPLDEMLMGSAFPAALHCVLNTDDPDTLQAGGKCLRTFLSKAPHQTCQFTDAEGRTGLWCIVQVATSLLHPSVPESSARDVGLLIITLINKAGDILGENLVPLLEGVLTKMQCSPSLVVKQGLITVYAHLLRTRTEYTVNLMANMPSAKGQTALRYVLITWLLRQLKFPTEYEHRVCTSALTRLLWYGFMSGDPRLCYMEIPVTFHTGEFVSLEHSNCPMLVNLCKILVRELKAASKAVDTVAVEPGGDEQSDDDEPIIYPRKVPVTVQEPLEDLRYGDLEIINDPVYHMNTLQFLTDYFKSFSQEDFFLPIINDMTAEERQVLASVGIPEADY